MYCKNHETTVATLQCSVCGEYFCDLCNSGSSEWDKPFVCSSCATKTEDTASVIEDSLSNNLEQVVEVNLADEILNDILSSVTVPEKSKINFDPSDILSQIEAGLDAEIYAQNFNEFESLNDVVSENNFVEVSENTNALVNDLGETIAVSVVAETVIDNVLESSEPSKVNLHKENNVAVENNFGNSLESDVTNSAINDVVADSIVEDSTVEVTKEKVSTVSYLKSKFGSAKDYTTQKVETIDMSATKEKAGKLAEDTKEMAGKLSVEAKDKAGKVSAEAKVKTAAATAYTVEKAKKAKTYASQKMASNSANLDETISKIQEANVNGEYDDLLSKFSTRYGQGAKETEDDTQFALPLKINNFLYFLCSLIPGIAQLYLGLTKRGTTILVIASVFLFVTMTPSLFFITSILSFADAYKLRNIYYRGGLIEDSNRDIVSFMKNQYIILLIIATVVINFFRAIF